LDSVEILFCNSGFIGGNFTESGAPVGFRQHQLGDIACLLMEHDAEQLERHLLGSVLSGSAYSCPSSHAVTGFFADFARSNFILYLSLCSGLR
jgi:hypothetical protein